MSDVCYLCKNNNNLKESHIIPSFVGKWLKDTSPTGYLRQIVNSNIRKQDITKQKLLCGKCEHELSIYEKQFAENVFFPYVNIELDEWSVAQGIIKEIKYEEWLQKFIVGLQWRSLISSRWDNLGVDKATDYRFQKEIESTEISWRGYLLGKREEPGESKHYMLFLQNLSAGRGILPPNISPRVNLYLCRAIDSTIAISETSLFMFTKMGPIVIISAMVPKYLVDMDDALIKENGAIKTAQHLANGIVNQFIFIDRPREAMELYKMSEKQEKKVEKETLKNASKGRGIKSILVGYSDYMMTKGKRMK